MKVGELTNADEGKKNTCARNKEMVCQEIGEILKSASVNNHNKLQKKKRWQNSLHVEDGYIMEKG